MIIILPLALILFLVVVFLLMRDTTKNELKNSTTVFVVGKVVSKHVKKNVYMPIHRCFGSRYSITVEFPILGSPDHKILRRTFVEEKKNDNFWGASLLSDNYTNLFHLVTEDTVIVIYSVNKPYINSIAIAKPSAEEIEKFSKPVVRTPEGVFYFGSEAETFLELERRKRLKK